MNMLLRFVDSLKRLFINGLLTLMPLTITVGFFSFVIRLIRTWLAPLRTLLPQLLQDVPFLEVVLVVTFIILTGLITQFFLINRIWDFFEGIVSKIPLLRPVYFGIKQLVTAFSPSQKEGFQKIALVEFPRAGLYSIAFITLNVPRELTPTDDTYYSAFIPATPNPTTGFYVLVRDTDCTMLDITKQEAMTIIISGGIVQPERFKEKTT